MWHYVGGRLTLQGVWILKPADFVVNCSNSCFTRVLCVQIIWNIDNGHIVTLLNGFRGGFRIFMGGGSVAGKNVKGKKWEWRCPPGSATGVSSSFQTLRTQLSISLQMSKTYTFYPHQEVYTSKTFSIP